MNRLTTDNPNNNLQFALNLFYVKNREAWVRCGMGDAKIENMSLCDFMRLIAKKYDLDIDISTDDAIEEDLYNWGEDGIDSLEGVVALLYTAAWVCAEMRERLKSYENAGLVPLKEVQP